MARIHRIKPTRTAVENGVDYARYRASLRQDFNSACGYCGVPDSYFGGIRGSHIDHFAPKRKFPALRNSYTNLVYSCPFCNRKKSETWPMDSHTPSHNGEEGFIDPCDPEYDKHLERTNDGSINAKSDLGSYMASRLGLNFLRHQVIWMAEELEQIREQLGNLSQAAATDQQDCSEILAMMCDLNSMIEEYRTRIFSI